ncbi:hypothetical protein [Vibrio sp. FF145]|uniref:hypothetical protein n=1 Tax=Vibrio sp. FF145 TaxID=3230013 RepID=UPI00352DBCD4
MTSYLINQWLCIAQARNYTTKTKAGFHVEFNYYVSENVAIPLTTRGQSDYHYRCFVPKPELVSW